MLVGASLYYIRKSEIGLDLASAAVATRKCRKRHYKGLQQMKIIITLKVIKNENIARPCATPYYPLRMSLSANMKGPSSDFRHDCKI